MDYNEALHKEIKGHFDKAYYLNSLITKDVDKIAANVCSQKGNSVKHMDSAKLGSCQAWIEQLCTLLPDDEIKRLTDSLEKREWTP